MTTGSLREIAAHVNTQGDGAPVILFNPLSWPRSEVTEIEAQLPEPAPKIRVTDSAESQRKPTAFDGPETHRARFLLLSNTPSFGYATYFVHGATKSASPCTPF